MAGANPRKEGLWLLVLLAVFWGANWPAMKLAVGELGPWTFRVVCVYVGAAGLFALALVRGSTSRCGRSRRPTD
jgi:drug/metabolite transporter (DMT)-like permease